MLISPILPVSLGLLSQLCNTASLYDREPALYHPFHVSVTQIQQNSKENMVRITCKIFTDDFEKDLQKDFNTEANLLNQADKPVIGKLINDYIKTHLHISIDGKLCSLQYTGFEQDEEAVDCYFQVNGITVNKTVAVTDNILFDYKAEQVNIVNITVMGIRKSAQLVNPDSKASFDFP